MKTNGKRGSEKHEMPLYEFPDGRVVEAPDKLVAQIYYCAARLVEKGATDVYTTVKGHFLVRNPLCIGKRYADAIGPVPEPKLRS